MIWQDLKKVLDPNQHWTVLDEGRLYKFDGTVAEGKKVLEELGYALRPPCLARPVVLFSASAGSRKCRRSSRSLSSIAWPCPLRFEWNQDLTGSDAEDGDEDDGEGSSGDDDGEDGDGNDDGGDDDDDDDEGDGGDDDDDDEGDDDEDE